jgi:hypothetical protein
MATISPEQLPVDYVEVQTSDILTVTGASVTILSASASPFLPNGVSITSSGSTVTISGKYPISLFDRSEVKTIIRGKSDKSSEVVTYDTFEEVPGDRQVYDYRAPSNPRVTITFNISVLEIDELTMAESISSLVVSKIVEFEYSSARDVLRSYI